MKKFLFKGDLDELVRFEIWMLLFCHRDERRSVFRYSFITGRSFKGFCRLKLRGSIILLLGVLGWFAWF